ncbi:hypothetical protein EG328_008372 [Venturia inaequalis]|uniref:MARVEL domain-containing protein n=1 Tax=Venturia inaequalis TaxID=5025 RepID=A0A8H3YRV4_VENIN|nr:hypothetical protein EG328_008372 [Venturia inaequalis]
MQRVSLCLRALQLLCAIVVFGLSVDISKEMCGYNDCSSANSKTTGFTAWAGGFGIIASVMGFWAFFWDRIKPTITTILDSTAALFFLAGGVVSIFSAFLASCFASPFIFRKGEKPNDIGLSLKAGFTKPSFSHLADRRNAYAIAGQLRGFKCSNINKFGFSDDFKAILKRLCTQNTADAVFCFFSFIVCLGLVAYGVIKRKEYRSSIA